MTDEFARFAWRTGTAAQWTAADPVLLEGEPGFESDTGLLKVGDGVTAWTGLDYFTPGGGGGTITAPDRVVFTPASVAQLSGSVALTTSGGGRWQSRRFLPTGTNVAAVPFYVPADWDTVDVVLDWCMAGTAGGNVAWRHQGIESAAPGDSLATSGASVDVVLAGGAAQDVLIRTTLATGLDVTNGRLSQFRLSRMGDAATDTATNSADLLRLMIVKAS